LIVRAKSSPTLVKPSSPLLVLPHSSTPYSSSSSFFSGTGFLPRETAEHHRKHVLEIVKQALKEANLTMPQIGR